MTSLDAYADGAAGRALAGATFLTPDNALRVTSFNSAAGVRLTIAGQILNCQGRVVGFSFDHVPNTDRTVATTTVRVGEGWLLNAHIVASSGTPRRGQCFARVETGQGATGAFFAQGTILQGYITDTAGRGYPGGALEFSTDGRGVIRAITGTDPAAGAECSDTVPTNARWRLLSWLATLVTSAAVANRRPTLLLDDGTTVYLRTETDNAQTASLSVPYMAFDAGRAPVGVNSSQQLAFPAEIILQGGHRIRTSTLAIDGADNWGAPQLLVEEWIED